MKSRSSPALNFGGLATNGRFRPTRLNGRHIGPSMSGSGSGSLVRSRSDEDYGLDSKGMAGAGDYTIVTVFGTIEGPEGKVRLVEVVLVDLRRVSLE